MLIPLGRGGYLSINSMYVDSRDWGCMFGIARLEGEWVLYLPFLAVRVKLS